MTTWRMAAGVGLATFLLSVLAGYMYDEGDGVAQSNQQAFAPDRNDPVASQCDLLADRPDDPQRVGNGVELQKIDVGQALPVCRSAAERRPVRPRYQYLYGRVLDAAKRDTEATAQYAAADQEGYALASASLGTKYETGQGVPKDPARAVSLYQRAGDAGDAESYASAAAVYLRANPPNYGQAHALADRAARAGSHWGTAILGEFYFGGLGVAKDEARGMTLLQQAADRGNPLAMLDLGLVYFSGVGVQQDKATALRWITRAADLGIVQAQNLAGTIYEKGDGVTPSDEQAIAWYRKSAAQGDPFGMTHLADLLDDAGNGAEAVDLYRKAAAMGSVDAYVNLGIYYDVGYSSAGLSSDPSQAAYWFGKAVEKGNSFAMTRLGQLYERGAGVERNPDRARQLYVQAGERGKDYLKFLNSEVPRNASPPNNTPPPPQPTIVPQDNTPDPLRRPLPTEPSLSDGAKTVLAAAGIGAAAYAVWWLLSRSGSSSGSDSSSGSSDSGTPYYPWADEARRPGECAPYLQPVPGGC